MDVACKRCGTPSEGQDRCPGCGSWLPGNRLAFPQGNTVALTHGARSDQLMARAAEAQDEIEALLGDSPGSEQRYLPLRRLTALAIARTSMLAEYLDSHGWLDAHGRPRPAFKALEAAEHAAAQHLERLGMSPASAGRLGLNLAKRQLTLAERAAAERR